MERAKPKPSHPILVVDDDQVFRSRLVKALEDRGLRAFGAKDGTEALRLAGEVKPVRAVVDLRMPGESGLETVRRLREADDHMLVIVLTGYGSIATAKEALRLGAHDYLTKPADTDQILAAFDAAEGHKRTPAPRSAPSLAQVEWEHIQRILADCDGNVSQAARVLGIHRRSLQRKLSKYAPMDGGQGM